MSWLTPITTFLTGLSGLAWALIVASLSFLILLYVTLRAPKPLRIPKLKPTAASSAKAEGLVASILAWFGRFWSDFKTFLNQDESRYHTPWILMVGDLGTGKSTLGASLVSSPRLRCLVPDPLKDPDKTGWWNFDKGMLIDVESLIDQTSEKEFASRMMNLRGERPLDGVLLCISAKELLENSHRELLDKAISLHAQLTSFQQQFNFTFPVYVLVTKADEVEGFKEFCSACSEKDRELEQIFGWSNPNSLDVVFDSECVDEAFAIIKESLLEKQLNFISTGKRDVEGSTDSFILFPRRLEALTKPLSKFLEQIFRASTHQSSFFFRGIYFSGLVDREKEVFAAQSPAPGMAFLDQLFSEKVFAEHNLAYPIKTGIWSRQHQIRRMQQWLIATCTVFFIGLGFVSLGINRQVNEIEDILTVIDYERGSNNLGLTACTNYQTIGQLLVQLSSVDLGIGSILIPLSWIDNRDQEVVAQVAAESVFREVLLPAFDCKIGAMETDLAEVELPTDSNSDVITSVPVLMDFVEQVLDQMIELDSVVSTRNQLATNRRVEDLDKLLHQLYGQGLPRSAQVEQQLVQEVLQHVLFGNYTTNPNNNAQIASNIRRFVPLLASRLTESLTLGGELLPKIGGGTATVDEIRQFVAWIDWVDSEWLVVENDSTACEDFSTKIQDELREMSGFTSFDGALNFSSSDFSVGDCQQLVKDNLSTFQYKTLPNIVAVSYGDGEAPDTYSLSPAWQEERNRLNSLSRLDFMQLRPVSEFACNSGATQWDSAIVSQAASYLREFSNFLSASNAPPLPASNNNQPVDSASVAAADQNDGSDANSGDANDTDDSSDTNPDNHAGNVNTNPTETAVENDTENVGNVNWPHIMLGRNNLDNVLNNLLSSAQGTAMQSGSSEGGGSVSQASIRSTSVGFNQSMGAFRSLFDMLNTVGLQSDDHPVTNCLQTFAVRQLSSVRALTNSTSLLQPSVSKTIELENGSPVLLFGGNVSPDNWWQLEFNRADMILNYAQPYVDVISLTGGEDNLSGPQQEIVKFWNNSLTQLQNKVEFGRSDGQVDNLDSLYKTIAGTTKASCEITVNALPAAVAGIDFFSDRLINNRQAFVDACNAVMSATGQGLIADLHSGFSRIQGRFPFADKEVTREANLGSVRTFFSNYGVNESDVAQYLRSQAGQNANALNNDLDIMQGATLFFNSHLTAAGPEVRLNLDVTFRAADPVNPNDPGPGVSLGDRSVMTWEMTNTIETLSRPARPNASLSWYYGDVLEVSFSWPSSYSPVDNGQANLSVDSDANKAVFSYDGDFALQRLIANHVRTGPAIGSTIPAPLVLEFNVPLKINDSHSSNSSSNQSSSTSADEDTQTARMFIELSVSTTDASGAPVPVFLPTVLPTEFPGDLQTTQSGAVQRAPQSSQQSSPQDSQSRSQSDSQSDPQTGSQTNSPPDSQQSN